MKISIVVLSLGIIWTLLSCKKDAVEILLPTSGLAKYVDENREFLISDKLIACAASQPATELDYSQYPISVFFYPVSGAYDFKYFESDTVAIDIKDYSKFEEKVLESEPVFNGYLRRFKNSTPTKDVWGIVTYKVENTLHICRAIRIKHYTKRTEFAPDLVTVSDSLTYPKFTWKDGAIEENAIYFQVVFSMENDLISGTYTYDKYFKFYDLSNVVLNIRDITPIPALLPSTNYNFMLMSVSEDNWVNLIAGKSFKTQ